MPYTELTFPAKWEIILQIDNQLNQTINHKSSFIIGWKRINKNDFVMKASHDVDSFIKSQQELKVSKIGIARFDSSSQTFQSSRNLLIMDQTDVLTTKEKEFEIQIPPKTNYVKWQLYIDLAGNKIYCNQFVINNGEEPEQFGAKALMGEMSAIKRIHYGVTEFRLKHVQTGKYLIITTKYNWPAADLGINKSYKFKIFKTDLGTVKIKSLNSMFPEYSVLYSAPSGGIYFGKETNTKDQQWTISKEELLSDGDIVELRNVQWPTAGLCFYDGTHTNVYCINKKYDEWMLVVC